MIPPFFSVRCQYLGSKNYSKGEKWEAVVLSVTSLDYLLILVSEIH